MPTPKKPFLDTLLAAFDAARTTPERTLAAMALARAQTRDDRILAALVRLLEENPFGAADCLATYGDPRALPDLVRAFDSDALIAQADCVICAAENLEELADSIELLGGTLTEAQRARLGAAIEQADRAWIPVSRPLAPGASPRRTAIREPRPERNAPCPCGSGKKYKRCCALELDGAGPLH
jgi:hypothetical protein